jgi:hypothetical protein
VVFFVFSFRESANLPLMFYTPKGAASAEIGSSFYYCLLAAGMLFEV